MSDAVVHASNETFEQEVLKAELPVLVDFWAPWCGPCRALGPTIDSLATKFEGKARIVKVNVDDSPDLARRYGVRSIPSVMVFSGGEVQASTVGQRSESEYETLLNAQVG